MWVSRNLASKNHDVTLVSARGSPMARERRGKRGMLPTLNVIETINPSYQGIPVEEAHYLTYKKLLEKDYGSGDGIVWDNTWHCFSYISTKNFPKMKIIHTNHGTIEWQKIPVKELRFPRYMGLSRLHAKYMSSILKIPIRYVHNGIPLPQIDETKLENHKNGGYLLSINRIVREKGIEDSIDLAVRTRNHIRIAGDDVHVTDHSYVDMIRKKCQDSDGLAEYIGLVDNRTKTDLIKNCKAIIACPKPSWIEAFGLYAVEANAYGKPVLALGNGGLNDIIVNQVNGFLAKTLGELQGYIDKVNECSPQACRRRVEKLFTDEIMTESYIHIFERVMEDEPDYRW